MGFKGGVWNKIRSYFIHNPNSIVKEDAPRGASSLSVLYI